MKKIILIGLMFAGMVQLSIAQQGPGGGEKGEKIKALKIAYITEQLNLTPEEAQQFWPVYNKYQDELDVIHKSRRTELMSAAVNFDQMSDADVDKLIDNEIASQQQELDLRKRYITEFKKVLPVKKVALLLRSEQTFKLKLLKEIQNRQEGRGNRQAPDIEGNK